MKSQLPPIIILCLLVGIAMMLMVCSGCMHTKGIKETGGHDSGPFSFCGARTKLPQAVFSNTVLILQAFSSLGAFVFAIFCLHYAI